MTILTSSLDGVEASESKFQIPNLKSAMSISISISISNF
jgi:hypothetical protein